MRSRCAIEGDIATAIREGRRLEDCVRRIVDIPEIEALLATIEIMGPPPAPFRPAEQESR